jgi:hypothetical protein
MTLIWLTLAFLAGALFWHKFGAWLFRKVIRGNNKLANDVVRNLDTDALVNLRRGATNELQRRQKVTEEAL